MIKLERMHSVKIFLGVFTILMAWVVVYRAGFVFKMNAWMRENVFNDQLVLFSGRRVAILLILLGGVALFSGVEDVTQVQRIQPRIADQMFQQAQKDFLAHHFDHVMRICRELIRSDPKNVQAWDLMGKAAEASGDMQIAQQAIDSVHRLDPDNALIPKTQPTPVSSKARKKKKSKA